MTSGRYKDHQPVLVWKLLPQSRVLRENLIGQPWQPTVTGPERSVPLWKVAPNPWRSWPSNGGHLPTYGWSSDECENRSALKILEPHDARVGNASSRPKKIRGAPGDWNSKNFFGEVRALLDPFFRREDDGLFARLGSY